MFKKAATELLSLKTDDVQSVMLASVHGKSEEIKKYLNLFPYFSGWSNKSLTECCMLSTIKRFLPETIIIDGADMNHSYTYFVIDGTCKVIQKIVLRLNTNFKGEKIFKMHSDQSLNGPCANGIEILFVVIRIFTVGDTFGLGENLKNRWVISSTGVRCLVIPKDFLLQHNQYNVWPRAKHRINCSFPDDEMIFKSIYQQVKWCRFKKEYFNSCIRYGHRVTASYADIPLYWKINVDVPDFLV